MKQAPQFKSVTLNYKDREFTLEYFFRPGPAETILMVHGLGGAKENYLEACKSTALDNYALISFDNPGTGNSTYYEDLPLDVDDLAEITSLFIDHLGISRFILIGTSMGGLTTMLYLQRGGIEKVIAYVNIEGNLMPEDCMFSSKVVKYDYETFSEHVFPQTIIDMKNRGNPGYHIIANNLQLNTNIKSYYDYSFQTVKYSSTGELLKQYRALTIPTIFIYGDENKGLSYLSEMTNNALATACISGSNHFIFYDNPKELYEAVQGFIKSL